MNTPELTPGPGKPVRVVRDECWELMAPLPLRIITTTAAVSRPLPLRLRLALLQPCRVHGPASVRRERGEQS
ncbi:hypothetical protein OG887_44585 (plasmid) [Streptomyces sp. NBC_00053]|uniref:hypothetical protein n=1 Tax=unclassified Streptomyces TaxID=2593676 RepID=UPI000F5B959F|nr:MULTISPECIES: hypothetical protein [unclassified Streptomyces]MCX4399936.1 hypothetical protein [Streptomyces sp. NBC_01767]MCX5506060.1 hypothetical protein [Streptomyces sp. NBC_00052]MCX5554285.1 hypothetical protein [Streptomyces sp. NBC_00051]RPK55655.1 hypothetical protein EES42_41855 [Streptomyces sp. ADI95-17]WSP52963.1 hypothetical protein OG348_45770 [Streptomyces sp. NBC_01243]